VIPLTEIRTRRIKKMLGEMTSDDQSITSPIDKIKIKTYFAVIDIVNTQVTKRFNEHSTPLFIDISLFQKNVFKKLQNPIA